MIFEINNVGKVQHAAVELNGLTIIVGTNDSGKSTVGKSLYSIVHATSVTRKNDKTGRIAMIEDKVKLLYSHIGFIRYQYDAIQKVMPVTPEVMLQQILSAGSGDEVDAFLNQILKVFREAELTPQLRKTFVDDIRAIRNVADMKSQNTMLGDTISEVLNVEFSNSVTTIGKQESCFVLRDESLHTRYIDCVVSDGLVKTLKTELEQGVSYEDATYIESPLYLQQVQHIMRNKGYNSDQPGQLPVHVVDQAEKVYAQTGTMIKNKNGDVESVIGGHFDFDAATGLLVLQRGEDIYPINNVASGLKAFGQIQILLKQGVVSSKRVLIWDEPENHLHPAWQLNFAEVLVQMVKEGYPLMITTHSPYMLQALRFYAAEYGIEKFVHYYASISEEEGDLCRFTEVTDSLNTVFLTLAEPLNQIMNVDEYRNKKKD